MAGGRCRQDREARHRGSRASRCGGPAAGLLAQPNWRPPTTACLAVLCSPHPAPDSPHPCPQAIAGGIQGIRRLEQRPLSVAEAKAAREVFLVGSSLPVMPVVQARLLLAPSCLREAVLGEAGSWRGRLCSPAVRGLPCKLLLLLPLPPPPPGERFQSRCLHDHPTCASRPSLPVQWDETTIGDGTAGIGALQLRVMLQVGWTGEPAGGAARVAAEARADELRGLAWCRAAAAVARHAAAHCAAARHAVLPLALQEDAKVREGGDQHVEVPYGYLTGML